MESEVVRRVLKFDFGSLSRLIEDLYTVVNVSSIRPLTTESVPVTMLTAVDAVSEARAISKEPGGTTVVLWARTVEAEMVVVEIKICWICWVGTRALDCSCISSCLVSLLGIIFL